jgi:hypothetical protein
MDNEWAEGDICWQCTAEVKAEMEKALEEIVAIDTHAGPFCSKCHSRPGFYGRARDIAARVLAPNPTGETDG